MTSKKKQSTEAAVREIRRRTRKKFAPEEKARDIETTLTAGIVGGRLALGGLLGNERLRVYQDGRIEGMALLEPEDTAAPRRTSGPGVSVVAGAGFEPTTSGHEWDSVI
ncbi:MAG: hypothetical protein JRE13_17405 [Deltaproteobacteria bacterium]|nr:hypothetical protein [Deltaproteobacteria bacterium]